MTGIYVHVPFCGSRCAYCDFFSTTMLERRDEYVEALRHELRERHTDDSVATVYLGGGTPSMLERRQIDTILAYIYDGFALLPDAEVTLEANPDDASETLLKGLPINRLSMGVQSFDGERLKMLRRRHTARQAVTAIDTALRCGITNISIDLIYGLPGQTMDEWRHDVEQALSLPITHISAYALSYEPGTLLYGMRERGEVREAGDELCRAMYYHLLEATEACGFTHYEISNFARPGFESRHNSSYWSGVPYLGFGPGAHSYDGIRTRRSNPADFGLWMRGEHEVEHLSDEDLWNEYVFLSLRTSHGMNLHDTRFAKRIRQARPQIDRLLSQGLLEEGDAGYVRLTRKAIFTSDDVISDLFYLK